MEKRFDITLTQGYVNKVAGMLNTHMIPVNSGDILHHLILGETKSGEVIKDWSKPEWNGICRQCRTVIETFVHIFNWKDDLSTNLGIQRITGLRTLIGDNYLWHIGKERPNIIAQFAISSFIIAKICVGRLTRHEIS